MLEIEGLEFWEQGSELLKQGLLKMRLRFQWLVLVLVRLGFLGLLERALLELLLGLELTQVLLRDHKAEFYFPDLKLEQKQETL